MFNLNEYQLRARETADYPEAGTGSKVAINYCLMGLGGEVGEIQNKWKKILRGDVIDEADMLRRCADLSNELGDVLWYLTRAVEEIDEIGALRIVAERNIEKLAARKENNQIKGDGDNR